MSQNEVLTDQQKKKLLKLRVRNRIQELIVYIAERKLTASRRRSIEETLEINRHVYQHLTGQQCE
jgi:hypothetical protein